MSPELAAEDLEDLLADPAALRERREGEVVGVHLAQAWKRGEQTQINAWNVDRTKTNCCQVSEERASK